jgi:hypothetical protein
MTKTYYVSSGDVKREVQADSPFDAAKAVVGTCDTETTLGYIVQVSDKGFSGDGNPWYVLTEKVINAIGHVLERE